MHAEPAGEKVSALLPSKGAKCFACGSGPECSALRSCAGEGAGVAAHNLPVHVDVGAGARLLRCLLGALFLCRLWSNLFKGADKTVLVQERGGLFVAKEEMASDLRRVSERIGKSYKQVHGLYKRTVKKINKLLAPFQTSVGASDYAELYSALCTFDRLVRSLGHPSEPSGPSRCLFAQRLHSALSHHRSLRQQHSSNPPRGFGSPQPSSTTHSRALSDPIHPSPDRTPHDRKLILRLFPADEACGLAVASTGRSMHLQLTVPASKRTASLLRHLRTKWSGAREQLRNAGRPASADLMLLRGDSQNKNARIPDTSESLLSVLGSSASDVQLWYRWTHERPAPSIPATTPVAAAQQQACVSPARTKKRKRITPQRIADVDPQAPRLPLLEMTSNANCSDAPPPERMREHNTGKHTESENANASHENFSCSPVTRAATWIDCEEEARELYEDELPDFFAHIDTGMNGALLPGYGAQVEDLATSATDEADNAVAAAACLVDGMS